MPNTKRESASCVYHHVTDYAQGLQQADVLLLCRVLRQLQRPRHRLVQAVQSSHLDVGRQSGIRGESCRLDADPSTVCYRPGRYSQLQCCPFPRRWPWLWFPQPSFERALRYVTLLYAII